MSDYIDSYYARTLVNAKEYAPLRKSSEAKVCVNGGGLAGLSTALGLSEKNIDTVVLEAHRVGWGASGRNGGFVGPGFSLPARQLVARVGREHAKCLYQLSRHGVNLVRERIKQYDIDCEPVIDGGLRPSWFNNKEGLKRERDFMHQHFGEVAQLWSREQVREVLLSECYYDALYQPDCLQIHPLNFARGIAAAAQFRGSRIFEQTKVVSLDLTSSPKVIHTESGVIRADHVVLTCGGYLGSLVPRLRAAIVPVATYVIATEALGEAKMHQVVRVPYSISDNKFANDYYRRLPDTRLLWGGRISVRQHCPPDLSRLMKRDLLKVYPQLKGVRIENAWYGLMSYARHKMPQIGQIHPNVWYAMGFGGHGLNTTSVAGELITTALAEYDDRIRLFSSFGLTPTMGLIGKSGAQLTYWYLQSKDKFHKVIEPRV